MKNCYFELKINSHSAEETILLYALGEELTLKYSFINRFIRVDHNTVRIEMDDKGEYFKNFAFITNALRLSKNYMAHVCQIIPVM